ncbi:MAG: type III toxin-antitoxin system ToxN/AbiQ family toxin [Clostridiales bacterium]|nr:type III toxin-antitoxin system ToxN/AbiQ family toxin [Clostridiales bacterium]
MEVKFNEFGIYNVDVAYLKYLHDNIDNEVYYASAKYEKKPFPGIIVGIGSYTYFIPFTSCKPKHLNWKNSSSDHYIIYEITEKNKLAENAVYKPVGGNMAKHILAVLDIKKMIPVPAGMYSKINFSELKDYKYKNLLEKEYRFCRSIQDGILDKVHKIYNYQKKTNIVRRFYCNFTLLEKGCDKYKKE